MNPSTPLQSTESEPGEARPVASLFGSLSTNTHRTTPSSVRSNPLHPSTTPAHPHSIEGHYRHEELGQLHGHHPIHTSTPSISKVQAKQAAPTPQTPTPPPASHVKIPHWVSLNIPKTIKKAMHKLFYRKAIQKAHQNILLSEQALTGEDAALDAYIETLSKKPSSTGNAYNEEDIAHLPTKKSDMQSLKEKWHAFVSSKKTADQETHTPSSTHLTNPVPTPLLHADSSATLLNEPEPSSAQKPKASYRPAELLLLRTTMRSCDGDTALAGAVFEKLAQPLYSPSMVEKTAKETLNALPPSAQSMSTSPSSFELDFESSLWTEKTLSAADGLIDYAHTERVKHAALQCAQTLASSNSLALAPLLAQQCDKREDELNISRCSKEAALKVYLQTGDTLGLKPDHPSMQFEAPKTSKEMYAQRANMGAQAILYAIAHQKEITLEAPKPQIEEAPTQEAFPRLTSTFTETNDKIILSEEIWTAYISNLWGYDDLSLNSTQDRAAGTILKNRSTYLHRAQKYQEAHNRLKKAKQVLLQERSTSAIKEGMHAQTAIFKRYAGQLIGKGKTPVSLPRSVFLSENHPIDEDTYREAIGTAIQSLQKHCLFQLSLNPLGDEHDYKTAVDMAFTWANLQVWSQRNIKGKAILSEYRNAKATHTLELTKDLLNKLPKEGGNEEVNEGGNGALAYFSKNQKAYKKELSRSWIPFFSKPVFFSIEKLEEIASTVFSLPDTATPETKAKFEEYKTQFDKSLEEALHASRGAPLQEAREAIKKAHNLSTDNTESSTAAIDALLAIERSQIVNLPPGSSTTTLNGNPRGINTGPVRTIPPVTLSPEIGGEYNRSALAQIQVHKAGFSMAWGQKLDMHVLLGNSVYGGIPPFKWGSFKLSLGASVSANIKFKKQNTHKTVLRMQYDAEDLSGTEATQKTMREIKAAATQHILQDAIPQAEHLSLAHIKNLTDHNKKEAAKYTRRQQYWSNLTRAAFYEPGLSISEQTVESVRITNSYSAQTSAYMGSNAYPNVPTVGPLIGVHVEHTPYEASRAFHIQNGHRQQQSLSQGSSHQEKISASIGMFASASPIRLPLRFEPIRMKFARHIPLIKFEKLLGNRGKSANLEYTYSATQLGPSPINLSIETQRSGFKNFGKQTKLLHKITRRKDAMLKNYWKAHYGDDNVETLLSKCHHKERHSNWVLRENYALKENPNDILTMHLENAQFDKKESKAYKKRPANSPRDATSKKRELEIYIEETQQRIAQIYADQLQTAPIPEAPQIEDMAPKTFFPHLIDTGFQAENVTTKSRSRGWNMLLRLEREQIQTSTIRTVELQPITQPSPRRLG